MDAKPQLTLDRLFRPRTVAVFGSVKAGKLAHQVLTQMTQGGFTGRIVAVNPKAEKPEGLSADILAIPSLSGFAGPVDLAVVAVPAPHVEAVLEDCSSARLPAAVVLSSGFSEAGNSEGEKRLLEVAREAGIRLIGPNCAGIMNTAVGLYASIEVRALPGKTALISQSGAVGGAVLALAGTRGIGFSKFVSYGNRADLGEEELLAYLAGDPETAVIALYVESVADGRRLLPVLEAAAAAKPVIAIKAGRTLAGERAAGSHTGAMAGADDVFAAAFRRSGVIRAAGIEELLDLCDAFSTLPPLKGKRIAIVTNSGGPGILAADRAEELGLQVAEPKPELKQALRAFLSERCSLGNPVDLTVEGTEESYARTLQMMLAGGYDGAIAVNVATPFLDSEALARGVVAGRDAAPAKPVTAVFLAGPIVESSVRLLRRAGIPCFPSGERAALALARLLEREELLAALRVPARPLPEPRPLPWSEKPAGGSVPEPTAASFLRGLGLPLPAFRFCRSPEEAQEAVPEFRFPLVMKVVSPEVLHKSERGGVVLGLKNAKEVRGAYADMAARFAGSGFRGALLVEQVEGGLEVIVGLKRDPLFGPIILAGMGGVWTELLRDVCLRLAPVDEEEASAMLAELKSAPLLAGFRGSPPRDRRALASLIARVSRLALEYPGIEEMDLNPVLVLPEGQGVRIADVRLLSGFAGSSIP